MSTRPSFQFYPADWRNNSKLRRCSEAARGSWMDILCVLHDSDEYGLVRWPVKELARAASVTFKFVRELVDREVLKGADSDFIGFTHIPRHAGKDGPPVILIQPCAGPLWFSSRFVKDEWLRSVRGGATRFQPPNQEPIQAVGETPSRSPTLRLGDESGDGSSSSSSTSSAERKVPLDKSNGRRSAARPKNGSAGDDLKTLLFRRGKEVLGDSAGGTITNVLKTFDGNMGKALAKIEDAAQQRDPPAWINTFLWKHGPAGIQVGRMDTS